MWALGAPGVMSLHGALLLGFVFIYAVVLKGVVLVFVFIIMYRACMACSLLGMVLIEVGLYFEYGTCSSFSHEGCILR